MSQCCFPDNCHNPSAPEFQRCRKSSSSCSCSCSTCGIEEEPINLEPTIVRTKLTREDFVS